MPVRGDSYKSTGRVLFAVLLSLLFNPLTMCAQAVTEPDVPASFKADMEAAARLRPQLMAHSMAIGNRYVVARLVFERLIGEARRTSALKLNWELRIVEDGQFNAYASPDGSVFAESGLAQLAGQSSGLWAAILSHEIAHVVRRDWARRYLFQKSLENGGASTIVLGDPGVTSGSWSDSEKASVGMGEFCRKMEVEADREGLMLMVRAGYHPDFVPALHHLLHAQESGRSVHSLYAMHPCWEERDHDLSRAYLDAAILFDRLWPERYASPGGNPPVVIFTQDATVRKKGPGAWQIQIPMRCQNLAGAVEVVLRFSGAGRTAAAPLKHLPDDRESQDFHEITGCTSPKTTVTFTLAGIEPKQSANRSTDVYVLDAWGSVLARADVPKLRR